ncbi:tyrosine-type recombinase/integrase [Natronomonas sp.]|uniref:tyrosine-type recombinase/integrase n=1 Tax=Natronomonas sp. TaxID=2184060 RepID=UPI0026339816|nr:site-specific integrase [Natronomonas sp.]
MSGTQPEAPTPSSYRVRIAPVNDGSGRREPPELSPRETLERWLDKLRVDKADSTVSAYHYRLKHFIEWCEAEGITAIGDVNGWDIETYETHRRRSGMATVSLNKELGTLKNFLEYAERIEVVEDGLPEKVDPPDVDQVDQVDDTRLHPDAARELLDTFEDSAEWRHSRGHALLTVAWYVGCRLGGLRALDLGHYDPGARTLEFEHAPDEGTPLKNGRDGERIVGLQDTVCDVLDGYIEDYRYGHVFDEYGREPLFTSQQGRPSTNSIRAWIYMATFPCHYRECPHGEDPEVCEFIDYSHASKCPSSRSPHQVRTGSITWQRNQGVPADVVAERVNASVRVIENHYDKPDKREEMEQRRRHHIDGLDLGEGGRSQ